MTYKNIDVTARIPRVELVRFERSNKDQKMMIRREPRRQPVHETVMEKKSQLCSCGIGDLSMEEVRCGLIL